MSDKFQQTNYPRISLKCRCGNEFNINVLRMKEKEPIICQICGEKLSEKTGEKFAKALEDLYGVKYHLEKDGFPFHFSFVYKSTFHQPPAPFPLDQEPNPKND